MKPTVNDVGDENGILASVKRISVNSAIYALGNILTRGLVFLLVPMLTRQLTPAEYGILAMTMIISNLLPVGLGLGIDNAVAQLYFKYQTDDERRRLYGTALIFLLVVPTTGTLLLEIAGRAGALDFVPSVPFNPYLHITIWASCLSVFITLPQAIYMTRQEPFKILALTMMSSVATVSLNFYLVVYLKRGLLGSLWATLFSAAITAAVSIVLAARMSIWQFSWAKIRAALAFSVPTVPHVMSQWALSMADRFVLISYVSTTALGLYSVGYQFGALVVLFSGAVQNALVPMINSHLTDAGARHKVPPLGTYAILSIVAVGLGVALFSEDAMRLIVPPRFQEGKAVVPWIVLGYVFHGVYLIWSRGTWFSMRTTLMPLLTILAAALNVGLNLWLVPRWGITAAAINTAVAYGALALMHGALATRLFRVPWEYGRWIKIILMATLCFLISTSLARSNWPQNMIIKGLSVLALFPLSLFIVRFLAPREKKFILSLPGRFGLGRLRTS